MIPFQESGEGWALGSERRRARPICHERLVVLPTGWMRLNVTSAGRTAPRARRSLMTTRAMVPGAWGSASGSWIRQRPLASKSCQPRARISSAPRDVCS